MAHNKRSANPLDATSENVALERALEGLFRLTANRRFGARQTKVVGAAVTRAGYALLRTLADGEVLSLREAADASHMDTAAASRQINQLVDDQLVSRRTATDARAIELTLTPLGHEVYARIVAYRLEHLGNALADWTSAERDALQVLVERLAADLGGTEPPSPVSASASADQVIEHLRRADILTAPDLVPPPTSGPPLRRRSDGETTQTRSAPR